MAKPTYRIRGIVLKKTRLGETDLIVTLLSADGSQVRAVAKGARKPKSSYAARLEIYSVVDLLLASGRNLSTIIEVRLVENNASLRSDVEANFAAATVVDLAERIAQPDLALARIFDATAKGLALLVAIAERVSADSAPSEDDRAAMLSLAAALLLKDLAFAGLRPAFTSCTACGEVLEIDETSVYGFSALDGGVRCSAHPGFGPQKMIGGAVLLWAHHLLYQPLDAIVERHPNLKGALAILMLVQDFIAAHTGYPLRSIECLRKSRLFQASV